MEHMTPEELASMMVNEYHMLNNPCSTCVYCKSTICNMRMCINGTVAWLNQPMKEVNKHD